ncbi:MAG TPA: PKD domain-containing protein [Kiritimatiellia bacterium]|nr:PKD domain-containing protein [Kiritimatiellia bacterium]
MRRFFIGAAILALGLVILLLGRGGDSTDLATREPSSDPAAQPEMPVASTPTPDAPANQPIAEFDRWLARWEQTPVARRNALVAEGIALARARREPFKALIRAHPETALHNAIPYARRVGLPAAIRVELEELVSAEARYEFAIACALGKEGATGGEERFVEADGRRWQAFTYGRRLDVNTKSHLSVLGVAMDALLALDEAPVRVLDANEVHARGLVSGSIWAESLGDIRAFENAGALDAWTESLLAAEAALDPESKPPRDGGDETATPVPLSAYTEGNKSILYIICDFPNLTGFPATVSTISNAMNNVTSYFHEVSFGKTRFSVTYVPSIVRLPQNGQSYTNNFSLLLTHAKTGAHALGFAPTNYNFWVVLTHESTAATNYFNFDYAGKAWVGAPGCHLVHNYYTLRTAGHELGHNLGLRHANYWRTDSDSPIGRDTEPGGYVTNGVNAEWVEYGHRFSTMSGQSTSDMNDRTAHFGPREKRQIDWITSSQVAVVTNSQTVRLYRFDHIQATQGPFAIHVKRTSSDYTGNLREYWLGYRMAFSSNAWLRHGLQIDWLRTTYGSDGAIQLDMTPFSNDSNTGSGISNDNNDKWDGALLIGRTYSDHPAGIHITPTARGGTSPHEWIDVILHIGPAPGNQPPTLTLTASATNAAVNGDLVFTATAVDPNGDALAYEWDFDLPKSIFTQTLNRAQVTNRWSTAGEYRVSCVASDMKGGRASTAIVVRIGSTNTFRIAGRVTSNGVPVEGVRVWTTHTNWTRTTSDGRYEIVNLRPASRTVSAQQGSNIFARGFDNPVVVDPSKTGIDFGVPGAPGLRFTPDSAAVQEGAALPYVVRLNSRPSNTVTITFSADAGQLTGFPASVQLAPNDWITGKTVSASTVNDALPGPAARTTLITHAAASIDTNYAGRNASLTVVIAEDDVNEPPVIEWLSPATDTAVVERTVLELAWTATDETGVTQTQLRVDGAPFATFTAMPWAIAWTAAPPGDIELTLVAWDTMGLAATSAPRLVTVRADLDGDGIPDDEDLDNDNDGLPDAFELLHFGGALNAGAHDDPDEDGFSNLSEYIAGTNPTNALSYFSATAGLAPDGFGIRVNAVAGRLYTLQYSADLMHSNTWHDVEGQVELPGTDGPMEFAPPALPASAVFRVHTRLAE